MSDDKGFDYRNFIAPVRGLVTSVIGVSKPVTHTPISEAIDDGEKSPKYRTGYAGQLEIGIVSSRQRAVNRIIFNGNSPILAEQEIIAYVLKADEEGLSRELFYVPRKFRTEETALWIEILGQDGKVLRRDYGTDIPGE